MHELLGSIWRFVVALSRRNDGIVDIIERDGTVLGSVVVQGRRLAYVAIPGDQRHLGRMLTELNPEHHAACVLALDRARATGAPFAASLLAVAPTTLHDVRACLLEQSARRLTVLCEVLRTQPVVAHFREANGRGVALDLTMDFWEIWQRIVAHGLNPLADVATTLFKTWQTTSASALLLHDAGHGALMPLARAGRARDATPGMIDDLASTISGTVRATGKAIAVGGRGTWSVTVRSRERAVWLSIDDELTLIHMLTDSSATSAPPAISASPEPT